MVHVKISMLYKFFMIAERSPAEKGALNDILLKSSSGILIKIVENYMLKVYFFRYLFRKMNSKATFE